MRKLLILLPIFLGASCASDKETAAPASTGRKSMEERFNSGPRTIAKDKNGEYPADVKKEFSLDGGRESAYFKGKSDMAKTYKTVLHAKSRLRDDMCVSAGTCMTGTCQSPPLVALPRGCRPPGWPC